MQAKLVVRIDDEEHTYQVGLLDACRIVGGMAGYTVDAEPMTRGWRIRSIKGPVTASDSGVSMAKAAELFYARVRKELDGAEKL